MTEFHGFPRFDAPRVGRVSVEEEATQTDDVPAPAAQLAQLAQHYPTSTYINFISLANWNRFPKVFSDLLYSYCH